MSKKKQRRRPNQPSGLETAQRYRRAVRAYETGNLLKARRGLQALLKGAPHHVEALVLLGRIHASAGDFDRSGSLLHKAIELAPTKAHLRLHLGEVFYQAGKEDEAIQALEAAHELDPSNLQTLDGLASVLFKHAKSQRSVELWTRARIYLERYCALAPTNLPKRWILAECYDREGEVNKRIRTLREIIDIDPDDTAASHLLAAAQGQDDATTTDVDYVRGVFDAAADRFDTELVDDLKYQVPEQIRCRVDDILPKGQSLGRVLDLGCGTGLVAEAIGDRCDWLAGVDVSSRMIEQAREKDRYDVLHVATLEDHLNETPDPYDTVIAADVFMYVGALEEVFERVRGKLTETGLFIFSTELLTEPGFQLRASGRFAHSDAYIRELAARIGFAQIQGEQMTVRMEGASALAGVLYVLRRGTRRDFECARRSRGGGEVTQGS